LFAVTNRFIVNCRGAVSFGGVGMSFSDVVKMGQSATAIVHETGKSVAAACVTYQLMSFVFVCCNKQVYCWLCMEKWLLVLSVCHWVLLW